ncbi:efflux RND transporter permease subunit [Marinicrinis sediminis]|uniref:Efflux RND transporter permease subunit n=1 Tax=Marinicrinis sediminis TaxID=1652465 RepID=A0ABW5R7K9_9BACL
MNLNQLTRFSLKNRVAILLLTALIVAAGWLGSQKINMETYPDVSLPVVVVNTMYPMASAEEVEEQVTTPLEHVLLGLPDYESVTSTSKENLSMIIVKYPFEKDIETARTEVDRAVAKVKLPDEAADSEATTLSLNSAPIYRTAVSSDEFADMQRFLEQTVQPELENIEGVASISLTGGESSSLSIIVDEQQASRYGLTLAHIQSAIEAANFKLPLGLLEAENQSIPLEVQGDLKTMEALKALTLTPALPSPSSPSSPSGTAMPSTAASPSPSQMPKADQKSPSETAGQNQSQSPASVGTSQITLGDVANISMTTERQDISRYNGVDSILLSVQKTDEANTAAVAAAVDERLIELLSGTDYRMDVVLNSGAEVEESVHALMSEGGYGALFTVIVILLFLRNFRATLIAIVSLPISILGTIALLEYFGYTLNIMTLGGMAVAVGRIVDDSIVVIENIYRWKQEHPAMKQREVVFRATREVMGAISSSTIATLIVFLPLVFVGDVIGEFFRPFSLAVVFSISISLLVAILLIPVLGDQLIRKVKPHREQIGSWTRGYRSLLVRSMKRKWLVFSLAFVLLVGSLMLIPALGVAFLPSGSQNQLEATVELSPSATLADTDALASDIEQYLDSQSVVMQHQVSIGFTEGNAIPAGMPQHNDHTATFFITLQDDASIHDHVLQYEQALLELAQAVDEKAVVSIQEVVQNGPPSSDAVDVYLYSDDLAALRAAAKQVENQFLQDDRLKNVRNDMSDTQTKWIFTQTDKGKALNVSPMQLYPLLHERLQPINGGTLSLDDTKWVWNLSYEERLSTREAIADLSMPTTAGQLKVGELFQIEEAAVPAEINHSNGRTSAIVSGQVVNVDETAAVSRAVMDDVEMLALPNNVTLEFTGGLHDITEGFVDLGYAMGAAIVLVFLVLTMTFSGIRTPMVILSSLIFVPIGSLLGLLLTGEPLSMSTMIGLLMLIGIVVTNAVVLLDRAEKNRIAGQDAMEAILEAAVTRLRPILMTALATIFALIPLAMSQSASGFISKGLAVTVIGGLTTSTLLTLVFVPVLYHALTKRKLYRKDMF